MTAWTALLLVWVVPFQIYGLPTAQVRAIVLEEPFFRVTYILLAVSSIGCMSIRFAPVVKRARRTPRPDASPGGTAGARRLDASTASAWSAGIGSAGFRRVVAGDTFVWAVRNRWAPVLSPVWHVALVLFMVLLTGYLISGGPAVAKFALTEGETFTGDPQQFFDRASRETYETFGAPLPAIDLEGLSARFHEDLLLFTHLEAELRTPAGWTAVAVGRPWMADDSTWVALEDFGYSVDVEFTPGDGGDAAELVYRTTTFPSGVADSFESPALGLAGRTYRIDISVFGDYAEVDGRPTARSFNKTDPAMEITVVRVLASGDARTVFGPSVVRLGETVDLGEDTLAIRAIPYYGVFRIVRSPWAVWVGVSLALLAAAVIARLLLPRTEVLVTADDQGRPVVRVLREIYGEPPVLRERIEAALGGAS